MKNLKVSLFELLSSFDSEYFAVVNRHDGGCNILFSHLIPSSLLVKLIAFCNLNDISFYVADALEFQPYRIKFAIFRR